MALVKFWFPGTTINNFGQCTLSSLLCTTNCFEGQHFAVPMSRCKRSLTTGPGCCNEMKWIKHTKGQSQGHGHIHCELCLCIYCGCIDPGSKSSYSLLLEIFEIAMPYTDGMFKESDLSCVCEPDGFHLGTNFKLVSNMFDVAHRDHSWATATGYCMFNP